MKCPRCPEGLVPVGTQGQAYACPRQHGVLLPREEVQRAFEPRDAATLLRARWGSATPTADCPACGAAMRRVRVLRPDARDLDACPACAAVWFDDGEAERLQAGPLVVWNDGVPHLLFDLLGRVQQGLAGTRP